VIGEVEPDGDELARSGHREAKARTAFHQGQAFGIDCSQAGERFGTERVGRDIRVPGQRTQAAGSIDQARQFLSRSAITAEFHGFSFVAERGSMVGDGGNRAWQHQRAAQAMHQPPSITCNCPVV
jgi:hypothetical protein